MASEAFLGEELAKTIGTIRVVVARREALTGQRLLTVGARETLAVIGRVLVADAALRDHLVALVALGRVGLLVARHAEDLVVLRYETLRADGRGTREAKETVLMELLTLVLHFFHAGLEYLRTFVTPFHVFQKTILVKFGHAKIWMEKIISKIGIITYFLLLYIFKVLIKVLIYYVRFLIKFSSFL